MDEKRLVNEKEQTQVTVEERKVLDLEVNVIDESKLLVPVSYKEQLKSLLKHREEMYLELCRICWHIKKNEIWKAEGANSIKEWFTDLEDEFDFSLQTFYGFARIGEFLEKHPYLKEEDLKKYGYSKLRELVFFCDTVKLSDKEDIVKKLFESTKELSLREFRKKIEEIRGIKATPKKREEKEVSLDRETISQLREEEWGIGSPDFEGEDKELMSLRRELAFDRDKERVTSETRGYRDSEEERGSLLSDFNSILEKLERGEKKSIILTYTEEVWEEVIKPVFDLVAHMTNIRDYSNAVLYVMYDFLNNHLDDFELIRETEK